MSICYNCSRSQETFPCDKCDKVYSSQGWLDRHQTTHEEPEEALSAEEKERRERLLSWYQNSPRHWTTDKSDPWKAGPYIPAELPPDEAWDYLQSMRGIPTDTYPQPMKKGNDVWPLNKYMPLHPDGGMEEAWEIIRLEGWMNEDNIFLDEIGLREVGKATMGVIQVDPRGRDYYRRVHGNRKVALRVRDEELRGQRITNNVHMWEKGPSSKADLRLSTPLLDLEGVDDSMDPRYRVLYEVNWGDDSYRSENIRDFVDTSDYGARTQVVEDIGRNFRRNLRNASFSVTILTREGNRSVAQARAESTMGLTSRVSAHQATQHFVNRLLEDGQFQAGPAGHASDTMEYAQKYQSRRSPPAFNVRVNVSPPFRGQYLSNIAMRGLNNLADVMRVTLVGIIHDDIRNDQIRMPPGKAPGLLGHIPEHDQNLRKWRLAKYMSSFNYDVIMYNLDGGFAQLIQAGPMTDGRQEPPDMSHGKYGFFLIRRGSIRTKPGSANLLLGLLDAIRDVETWKFNNNQVANIAQRENISHGLAKGKADLINREFREEILKRYPKRGHPYSYGVYDEVMYREDHSRRCPLSKPARGGKEPEGECLGPSECDHQVDLFIKAVKNYIMYKNMYDRGFLDVDQWKYIEGYVERYKEKGGRKVAQYKPQSSWLFLAENKYRFPRIDSFMKSHFEDFLNPPIEIEEIEEVVSEPTALACPHCNRSDFKSEGGLKIHINRMHSED